ncbi:conjugal transfer protein TraH (plasmid) [Burkholderia thailandensis]|uniref:conjugal transfer protein TraH n=1 Tax=Burkholderia thailandensis TaxID=57975 RepID=UPI00192DF6EE|nr:conjugal transfer protein TraH [Burkholderia thailandensis]MBS2132330.1 conjugal transfer protein TraH [Burkholderia thailandensis]QRA15137.1 conjugal transfer protein TraH [Burkholderia thailandensis]
MWKRLIVIVALATASIVTHAMSMQDVFNSINAQGNISDPRALQGQTMNMYSGGSVFMRTPHKTYQLASVTAPSWGAGCGGIDLFTGGFSFINKEQFVALLRNIGSNALGYAFKLAIQNLCPTCDNVMQALQSIAKDINRMNIDSCQAAEGIVNAVTPDTWKKEQANLADTMGPFANLYSDMTDAWSNIAGNASQAAQTIDTATSGDASLAAKQPYGNVTWQALLQLPDLSTSDREFLMSLIGTVIFPDPSNSNGAEVNPVFLPRIGSITVAELVGNDPASSSTATIQLYSCDEPTKCINPSTQEVTFTTFRSLVQQKLQNIEDAIASRSAMPDAADTFRFLSMTDLPVYKMIAVGTRLNNPAVADQLLTTYQSLIAAKYAQAYIHSSAEDLRRAIARYSTVSSSTSLLQEASKINDNIDSVERESSQAVMQAYSQTSNTWALVEQLQAMERAVHSNLSSTLRNSIAFGQTLNSGSVQ